MTMRWGTAIRFWNTLLRAARVSKNNMKIFIASDHAGFELKNKLISFLKNEGHEVIDKGPFEFKILDDYPDFISLVAREISHAPEEARGLIMGGSGQGEAMVANRFPGVRAAVYYGGDYETLKLSREHNDANILSLGARMMTDEEAKDAVAYWLKTPFTQEERHVRRINKIDQYPG